MIRTFLLVPMVVAMPIVAAAPQSSAARQPAPADTIDISRALRLAVERNRDIRTASLSLTEAGHQAGEARSAVYPRVEWNAGYTRNIAPAVSFLPAKIFDPSAGDDELIKVQFGADNVWNSTLSFEQPLFQARAFLGIGAAGRFKELQEEALRGATQNVVTRVRVAFYDVLLAQEQERLLGSSVARVRTSLTEAQAMHRAGTASAYDVLRLEVELANLEPNVRRAANAVTQSRRQLAVELAMPEIERTGVRGTLTEPGFLALAAGAPVTLASSESRSTSAASEALVAAALDQRSDIRQLELTRSLRRTELRAEQLEYAPKVSLFGNLTVNAQHNGAPEFFGANAQQRSTSKLAGISVTMPIFTGFSEHARIGQRRAVVRSVETQLELARDRAQAEVRSLVDRVDEADQRVAGQRLAVQQARRGFEIVSLQYREGMSGRLERTDAEVALRQSEFNYAQAVYDYLVARAQLDEATGQVSVAGSQRVAALGAGGAQ